MRGYFPDLGKRQFDLGSHPAFFFFNATSSASWEQLDCDLLQPAPLTFSWAFSTAARSQVRKEKGFLVHKLPCLRLVPPGCVLQHSHTCCLVPHVFREIGLIQKHKHNRVRGICESDQLLLFLKAIPRALTMIVYVRKSSHGHIITYTHRLANQIGLVCVSVLCFFS